MRLTRALPTLGALALLGAAAPAQEPVFELRFAGFDALLTSDKDAGLRTALGLVALRLSDLEHELELDPEEGEAIRLAWDIASGALSIRLDQIDAEPGMALAISSRPAGATAKSVIERIVSFAQMGGVPIEVDDAGAAFVDSPAGPASLRLIDQSAALTVGEVEPASLTLMSGSLPDGAIAAMTMRLDLDALSGVLTPILEQQSPEMAQALAQSGWLAEGAPTIEFALGSSADATHFYSRIIGAAQVMSAAGAGPDVTFSPDDFAVVPRDAVRVYANPISLEGLLALAEAAEGQSGQDPIAEVSQELGFDVRTDVIENLGPRAIVYQSDTTGGGGLLSSIVMLDLRDPAAMNNAIAKVAERFNAEMLSNANGYVRIHTQRRAGNEIYSLITPGLPLPIEASWAIADGRLVLALLPSSLDAALAQMKDHKSSVLDSEAFASTILARIPEQGASAVSYADSNRLARRGYGATNLLLTALGNGVRSPNEPDRISAPLMAPFADFTHDVRSSGTVSYWDGDDYITVGIADPSKAVAFASAVASFSELQGVAVPALLAGVMLPALGQARLAARKSLGGSQIRAIVQGIVIYGMENDETMPASFEDLLRNDFISTEMLESPFGPALDGGPDFGVWFDLPGDRAFSFDANQIIVIDRAMLLRRGDSVSVGFADNHVETLTIWELEEYLALPQNAGAREALGIPDL